MSDAVGDALSTNRQEAAGGESRVEAAYKHLKMAIVSAQLPAGSPISELDVARELKISRTPIREAIRQLERDGLVVRFANRGVFVRQVDMREVSEIWQVREWLEPRACELASGRIALDPLVALREEMASLRDATDTSLHDFEVHHELDLRLHSLISTASGNVTLATIVEGLTLRSQQQMRMVHRPERLVAANIEHIAIIDALIAQDPHAAAEAMRVHLRNQSTRESVFH